MSIQKPHLHKFYDVRLTVIADNNIMSLQVQQLKRMDFNILAPRIKQWQETRIFKGNLWPTNTSKGRENMAKKTQNGIIYDFFFNDQYMVNYYTERQYYKT